MILLTWQLNMWAATASRCGAWQQIGARRLNTIYRVAGRIAAGVEKRIRPLGAALVFLSILSACASAGKVPVVAEKRGQGADTASFHVAVLPFENLTDHPKAGKVMTRLMLTELYRQHTFSVREAPHREQRLQYGMAADTLPTQKVRELAHTLNVDGVLLGSVTEYRYQHGLREEPVVGLSVRMVRTCDGKVVWAANRGVVGRGFFNRESLSQVGQRIVAALVGAVEQLEAEEMNCSPFSPDDSAEGKSHPFAPVNSRKQEAAP